MSNSDVLGIDVGATSIKSRRFDAAGEPRGARSRKRTPYPCTPERLVELLSAMTQKVPVGRVGVGFPGSVHGGVVTDAANLTRLGGSNSPVDPDLARQWRAFDLRTALEVSTGAEVVVDNDAAMAARGCATGAGVELVVTLGTGCGIALLHDSALQPVRDFGSEPLIGALTYDELLGERGRKIDEAAWVLRVVDAVQALAAQFAATTTHLAGGNARRLSPNEFGAFATQLVIERDDPALLGAYRAVVG